MAKRKRLTTPFGTETSIAELRDFVGGWKDKVNIPPDWIRTNLRWARGELAKEDKRYDRYGKRRKK